MLKVLFVTPPMGAWATHGKHKAPNQFYAQLAAYLRNKNSAEVLVLDAKAEDLSQEEMLKRIKEYSPDLVVLGDILHSYGGFSVIWHFNETARLIKEQSPQIKIAVGGIWYPHFYKETLEQNPCIDFVIVGEAEVTLSDLCLALTSDSQDVSKVKGIAFRKDNLISLGGYRPLIKNLDDLPLPAYDLFPMDKYVGHSYWRPFVEMVTSRGCPAGCAFCYEWSDYDPRSPRDFFSWRAKSAKGVVEELKYLEKNFGTKVVVFQDDSFNIDMQRVEDICQGIIREKLSLKWVILGRANDWVRQKELIPLMKKAGLFLGLVGIEVANDEELLRLGKGVTTAQIKETVDMLRSQDIATVGTIMLGFEDDDEAKIKERFEFTDFVDPDILWIGFLTPVPGSPIWPEVVKRGWINPQHIDLRKWDFLHPVVPTNFLSLEDLGRLGAWCMREFYAKTERIQRLLGSNYDELVKLLIKDYLDNIPKFEASATKGETFV